ncbi:nuclear transport factor 2 family protein [Nocardioides sp.]|uniref:nuclear transport factor 2 family protein n=1 Tax=Nocardioides sp. TaxID=35761 RepID=UPI002614D822|nr:nuclear transport factor 2 family protein [Nocardioides sp.]
MPTRDQVAGVLDAYVEALGAHDVDALVALFAPDGVKHEPLGIATHRGHAELRSFDEAAARADFTVSRHSPVTIAGRFAAMQVLVQASGMDPFLATDLFELDDDGRIISLQVLIDIESRP